MKKLDADLLRQAEKNNGRPPKEQKVINPMLISTFEWMQAAAIAIVTVVVAMTFVFRIVDVRGDSMLNTLFDGDKVLVYSLMYTPKQGDVVIVSHAEKYDEPIVKRVIASEGQKVDIDYNTGDVFVADQKLSEDYLTFKIEGLRTGYDDISFPLIVPEGCLFVLGDNRPVSLDSRTSTIGFVDCDDVIGKATFVVYPMSRIAAVH